MGHYTEVALTIFNMILFLINIFEQFCLFILREHSHLTIDNSAGERVNRVLVEALLDSRESGESGESGVPDSLGDLLIGMIRDLVINQINAILGITTTTTTTTTPCTGLVGGGLLCPPGK